jgi:hypothetical protein
VVDGFDVSEGMYLGAALLPKGFVGLACIAAGAPARLWGMAEQRSAAAPGRGLNPGEVIVGHAAFAG